MRRAIDPARPLTYRRRSQLDDIEPAIVEVLERYPRMPAAGVARRLGWQGSMSAFTDRVRLARRRLRYGAP